MDRGTWQVTLRGCKELDKTEQLTLSMKKWLTSRDIHKCRGEPLGHTLFSLTMLAKADTRKSTCWPGQGTDALTLYWHTYKL